ncbi:2-oxoglutarate-dependent dioxygenase 11-like [Gossypium arboreum]|uniref:2-oxoglutarate-dependent dioxygenase 11-like n=1 Tax=Gossypium arboreum TaxID=29729 RepID=UPI0022F1A5DE|nr:2-oxoglutarate-dependent dioxygenase 11-like [Gossypium arboreum]
MVLLHVAYSMELHKVMIYLMKQISKNLRSDPEKLSSFFEDGIQGIRMKYYPPCVEASKVYGLAPHLDATGLTLMLLLQVNEVEGLQIKRNEKWVTVKPILTAFIINIGDMVEIMSNGEYKSIEHRVVVNPGKEWVSMAALRYGNKNAQVGPLPDLVKTNKAPYKTIPVEEFLKL